MIKLLTLLFLLITSPAWAIKIAVGTYTGNNADPRNIDISDTSSPSVADFQPEACIIKGDTTQQGVWSTVTMGADSSLIIGDPTGFATNMIQGFNANGFQVGNDNTVNNTATVYHYICFAPDGNADFAVGTYSGNSTDNRTIDISDTSTGGIADFNPEFVMIHTPDTVDPVWRGSTAHATNESALFWAVGNQANHIQTTNANGFEVGTATEVNQTGKTYYYMAIKGSTDLTETGQYTGDGTSDNVTINIGFQPDFVLVKRDGSIQAFARWGTNSGDESARPREAFAFETDAIQAFNASGFEVGNLLYTAESYEWFAIKVQTAGAATRRIAPIFFQ